ncbi:LysM peptidoglycan-binding domain-containing protein [Enterococcus wangshanyuanii]|uniref:LysM domain-containing protein n=1 Tax=Enterococcus wangshanyuanii TaxID=2005703 RepID=A0ABQ1PXD7_9ENTE|nr:LysM domain-containing protein [Enterococcus wangshanyuanii]GGD06091.1 hypothetical protein GCM10011573_39380 [Enterococcus wangshanyuanii]
MKKVFMVSIVLIALAGCGSNTGKTEDSSSSSKTEQSTSSSTKESFTSISSSSTTISSETNQSAAVLQETQQPESEVVAEEAVPSSEEQPVQTSEPQQAIYDAAQPDEGPNQVAARNGITLEELMELNGMTGEEMLQPGQELRVK